MVLTLHGEERIKQRFGYSKKVAQEKAEKALRLGLKHSELKGSLKRFVDGLYLRHKNSNNTRILHREVYLFHNDVLVTAIPLPRHYWKTADKLQKRKGVN